MNDTSLELHDHNVIKTDGKSSITNLHVLLNIITDNSGGPRGVERVPPSNLFHFQVVSGKIMLNRT